jgi:hypothetical protein
VEDARMIQYQCHQHNAAEQAERHTSYMQPGKLYRVTAKILRAKRSVGKYSQNHRINGFIQQICKATGNNFTVVKEYLKIESLGEGYPFETLPNGKTMPKSEADLDTAEASIFIKTIERFAAEWDIRLIEASDEG